MGTARGSTDVAPRPPKRTGIDTATCDSALTLQADSSQLANSLPGACCRAWIRDCQSLLQRCRPTPQRKQLQDELQLLHLHARHGPGRRCAAGLPPRCMALLPDDAAPRAATATATAAATTTRTSSSVTARMQQRKQLRDWLQLLAGPHLSTSTCEPGRGERPKARRPGLQKLHSKT